ncbi:hypothetical protein BD779DRAFT_1675711 [Infundibulicybe gibba]|nr:hypothetical protein BD779DRAFT_1675711 [Infundibulicybe gibba]
MSKGSLKSDEPRAHVESELKNTKIVTGGSGGKRKVDAIDDDDDDQPERKTAMENHDNNNDEEKEGEGEGEGESEVKIEGFDKLPAERKEKLLGKGNAALDRFLSNPRRGIPPEVRKMIRENQSFLPRAAYTSREMALECLRTNRNNRFCLYHHRTDRRGRAKDGQGKYKLNGVPMQRAASFRKSDGVPAPKGHLHCSCEIDVALADFIHWKTWKVTGKVDGEEFTESLQDQQLQPRERLFVVKNFEKATNLKLGDLYWGNKNERQFEKRKMEKQVLRCLKIFNKMRAEDGEGVLELAVCDGNDSAE